ncbi:HNH endonuclease [Paenibacillus sp.]|uniref:HNH endonuclease n=1 Tax=Paenibacillus sp. TaxID=58172 RepID=UPI002D4C2F75|nr:HNH endonuclease [Paenibacillus sp.]HZG57740.1 HNH endonuclease [Paenibacillus sp.]
MFDSHRPPPPSVCALCGRTGVATTVHHLTPKEKGGTFLPTADLCAACHKTIHATFTNAELAAGLSTLEALRADERLAPYLRWIRKQPPSAVPRVKKTRAMRSRR